MQYRKQAGISPESDSWLISVQERGCQYFRFVVFVIMLASQWAKQCARSPIVQSLAELYSSRPIYFIELKRVRTAQLLMIVA